MNAMEPPGYADRRVKATLDTGAGQTAFPLKTPLVELQKPNGSKYKTANGILVSDEGGGTMKGWTTKDKGVRITGRFADVHKILLSGTRVANEKNDMWLGDDGGYIMPRSGKIAQAMRSHFDHLVEKYGDKELIDVYIEGGVYVTDIIIPVVNDMNAKDERVAPPEETMEDSGTAESSTRASDPSFPRQAAQP